ncbi:hypothetical protein BD560DRAFT_407208 [Blakeslea trispora]|nr:hypothetical protein BD560DRAFT_407208 [Blakeslea trispora]
MKSLIFLLHLISNWGLFVYSQLLSLNTIIQFLLLVFHWVPETEGWFVLILNVILL